MKLLSACLCVVATLSVSSAQAPAQAQSRAVETRTVAPYYDVAREVTVTGTVSNVLRKPSVGMIQGAHILLQTSSGLVDASLGRWGLRGKGALSVNEGQHVAVTGVLKTLMGRSVFIVRTVKVDGQVYTVRDAHGIQVSPQTRERLSQHTAQKGTGL